MQYWADAEVVAGAIASLIEKGVDGKGEIPLRVPLGADRYVHTDFVISPITNFDDMLNGEFSWGLQKKGLEVALQRLEKVKEISLSTSQEPEKQLASIEFLQL